MESPGNTSALVSKIAWQRIRGKLGCINDIKLPQTPVSVVLWTGHEVKSSLLHWIGVFCIAQLSGKASNPLNHNGPQETCWEKPCAQKHTKTHDLGKDFTNSCKCWLLCRGDCSVQCTFQNSDLLHETINISIFISLHPFFLTFYHFFFSQKCHTSAKQG